LFFYLDSIVRKSIEWGATYALGTETTVGSVQLGLFSGKFGFSRFVVQNPPGFAPGHFLILDHGELSVGLATLASDTVEARELILDGMDIRLSRMGDRSNYDPIFDHLRKKQNTGEKSATPGKKFITHKLVVRDITAHVELVPPLGKLTQVEVKIPQVQLENVGSGSGGVEISELTRLILKTTLHAVVRNSSSLPVQISGDLRGALSGPGLKGKARSMMERTSRALGDFFSSGDK
jgi:hypothetical protein